MHICTQQQLYRSFQERMYKMFDMVVVLFNVMFCLCDVYDLRIKNSLYLALWEGVLILLNVFAFANKLCHASLVM